MARHGIAEGQSGINGYTGVVLTKLDVLGGLDELNMHRV